MLKWPIYHACVTEIHEPYDKKNKHSETILHVFSGGINRLQQNIVRLLTPLTVHHGIHSIQHSTSTVHKQSDLRPADLYI